ncbi:DMT family transporter [Alkalilimnicola sp. S0819]|uniref:DMT family transporter n=1 Tax=Alkalilimnicola sp. S0819 TaxID=2613922 RepID=UPI00126252DE|nr:DMT family transporter [Alkalilimnicola sp. S0819]KAB7627780.1 DMT family transporter [Alkalilimnicola sp. S0819]MPQ15408.1 EamA family transporter [Alkalilimnicola sp. S0819]
MSAATSSHSLRADALLLLVTLLAAAGWIFSKEALVGLPPQLFIGIRFGFAGLILLALGWRSVRALDRRGWRQALGVGALFAAAIVCWIMGLHHARHLGEGAFITALGIVLVPVIARWVFGDRPPGSTWVALPVAIAGFACLSLQHGFRIEPGQWYFLGAALFFALLFNINTHVVGRIPVVALTGIQLLVVGVVALAVSVALEDWPTVVAPSIWGWLLASMLLATVGRFYLQIRAQGMTSSSHAAVLMMLEPVWTALLAGWWFGETMGLLQFAGCALIFLALVINRWHWIARLLKTALRV